MLGYIRLEIESKKINKKWEIKLHTREGLSKISTD